MSRLIAVRTEEDLAATVRLFEAYTRALGIDLAFQGLAEELASMPGKYAPPAGELLLARHDDGRPLGCVGLRPLGEPGICEMKRLYVDPAARGLKLGSALVNRIIEVAKERGYREMRLDTLAHMAPALGLYRAAGFETIPAYYETPLPDTVFLRLKLAAA